ncbi:IclR family transcriptional regulator [Pelosinus propionicus]|uniref:DNA-binding transcriptional regulator, IclR family n=1 Tax=Pelosinus propionicus DSM 13327 TaxID=1123291 RepID=A0A1I4Q1M4_9FIRM|nr:IclR family transcriptional regulator [Pelosinus propionicus]SFM33535.1 DNA-binding transcriptional regulator, IclR family [Pelosinus propionicus DSM 13327]
MKESEAKESVTESNIDPTLKAIAIMEYLSTCSTGKGIADISRGTGLNKSTIHRILNALVARNYVIKDEETRLYRLGLKILQLSNVVLDSLQVKNIAHDLMLSLAEECRETIHLIWLEGNKGVYVDKIDTPESVGLLSQMGMQITLYCTAAGKAILAFSEASQIEDYLQKTDIVAMTPFTLCDKQQIILQLKQIRYQGYALDKEENRLGIVCVAAPIFQGKKPIAAISISGPAFRFSSEIAEGWALRLIETCVNVSKKLGS